MPPSFHHIAAAADRTRAVLAVAPPFTKMSSGRRLPAAALSTLFFAMHTGAFRLGVNTAGERTQQAGEAFQHVAHCTTSVSRQPGFVCTTHMTLETAAAALTGVPCTGKLSSL